jgi:hypothetical protein
MNCCFCGPIKNCAPYLDKIFENIEKMGSIFDDYRIVVFYDDSQDNTLHKLKEYKEKNSRFEYYVNKETISPFRTHRIAKARNYCLDQIREKYSDYPFFIMMDFDNVNCKNVNSYILKKYLNRDDWDGLSFNTKDGYYDIWALSIRPFYFSYNHFKNNYSFHGIIHKYINEILKTLPEGELLPCLSSFNGFSIYKTKKFLNCFYDGRIRMDLIPRPFLQEHMIAAQSPIVYKYYGLSGKEYEKIDGRKEDCEHRSFHYMAIHSGAKIRISPEIIFY